MNYTLNNIPERTSKPRESGFSMVMDKGLSLRGVEDLIETCGDLIDIVKFGWATSYVTPKLEEQGIPVSRCRNPLLFWWNAI